MGAESFTLLAVLEAQDRASAVFERYDAALDRFAGTAERAAEAARSSGAAIDSSLLETASGADALELSAARVATAEEKLAASTAAQADAEQALLKAREVVAGEQDMAAAATELAAAEEKAALAAKELSDAKANQSSLKAAKASEAELAAAADALAAADQRATVASKELSDAKARDAALTKPADVLAAADALTAAEKKTSAASRELSDAQAKQAATSKAAAGEADAAAATAGGLSHGLGLAALGMAAAGGLTIKAAGDFQSSVQHLATDAGESQKNLQLVSSGILQIASSTGTSTSALSDAMYHIESAGFHGAAGLKLLQTAAQGAKVGGADFETVAKTLTGTMNAYNLTGDQATSMMNQLIATVGAGDMKMQDLASSLGNVAPLAAAAGISFDQVGGAIATMTGQNMSAQQATQDLAGTIRALSNPNQVAIDEMQQLGLNANDVSQNLGKNGLVGTLEHLTEAIAAHTQGGQVLVDSLKASKAAAADAQVMFKQLPPSIQGSAKALQDGQLSVKQWDAAVKQLPATQQKMAQQFAHVVDGTQQFNKQLASGSPAAQTYNAALSKLLGGATGLNTALMLTGSRMDTFTEATNAVTEAGNKGGDSVDNWDKIQSTFNQKLQVAKASVEAAAVAIGLHLLPAATAVAGAIADVVGPMATWISHNQKLVGLILAVVGGALAAVGVIKTISMVTKLWAAAQELLNLAMAENPIGLIIIALAALAAGVYYAWTHFKTFREIVMGALTAVKDTAMVVWHALETAWNAIAAAGVWLWHQLVGAFNGVVGAVMAVWHAISGAWDAISSATSTVFNAIVGFFKKWWPLLLVIFAKPIADLISVWNHYHKEITDTVKTVWGWVSTFFETEWKGISAVAQAAWRLFAKYVIDPLEILWGYIHEAWTAVAGWLQGQWNGFMGLVSAVWHEVKKLIIDPLTEAWHEVASIGDKIGSTISGAFQSAKNFVMGIVHDFESIGSDIVHGIVKGITSVGGMIGDKIKGLANDALKSAKSFLGISSPSKVMADQVGKWIPHGIAKGVQDHSQAAVDAVSDMAGALPGAAAGALGGTGAPVGAGAGFGRPNARSAGGGTGATVIIDLRNSQIMSDKDMDTLADKIGRALPKALAGGGVRINMA